MIGTGFAILDVQTTGLRPRFDRIVELAIVRTDAWGNTIAEIATLVNPERAVGATDIHGITNADVRGAPPFRDVAGHVVDMLRGAVVVSHNSSFDSMFLSNELARIGVTPFDRAELCTLEESARWLQPLFGRSLSSCCDRVGVQVEQQYHAQSHARATRALFVELAKRLLHERGGIPYERSLQHAYVVQWPSLSGRAPLLPREAALQSRQRRRSPIGALVDCLPATSSAAIEVQGYLLALDLALEDRSVTAEEGAELRELALEMGIGSGDLPRIHFNYLCDLACAAVADGVVTEGERADLITVAMLLGFPGAAVPAALDAAKRMPGTLAIADRRPLTPGMKICFSDTQTAKEDLEDIARVRGLLIRTQVSRQTDVVVTADPLSQSAKLQKARALGTRILLESIFLAMMLPPRPAEPIAVSGASPTWVAGWYPDPSGTPAFRYWDGLAWTQHVRHGPPRQ